ncbi:DUF2142 domain-containing protein [Asaia sp. BMEF1]|uniref:DUF2142 domain-containing protein n=1 Tax=Asaia sp. BMEF1 TaxID=3155932 RepID=UPI003F66DF08
MAMACVLLTPPGQSPDERNHLARVVQISQGGFVGLKNGAKEAGGYLPANFPTEAEMLNSLRFNPKAKVPMPELLALSQRHWSRERSWTSFGNTVIYAPIAYLPGAATSFVARHGRATIIQTSYAVRTVNALCTVLLCTLGIAIARRGTLYLGVISSLPMVMALGASCSQDGVIIGLSVLTAALLTRLDERKLGSTHLWVVIAILFSVLTVSKPPLLLCSLIPLGFARPARAWLGALPLISSIAAFLCWQKFGLDPAKIVFRDGSGVSDSGQVHWVLTHPQLLPALAYHTLRQNIGHNIHEFLGVLGWLDTLFPSWFYNLIAGVIGAALAFSGYPAIRERELRQARPVVALTVISMALATGGVFFSIYVIWTPVGAPVIDGVQGRYFLPIAPFLALVFPKLAVACRVSSSLRVHQMAMLALGLFLALDMVTLTCVLASRYWLA